MAFFLLLTISLRFDAQGADFWDTNDALIKEALRELDPLHGLPNLTDGTHGIQT
jgi:hypothetical protein